MTYRVAVMDIGIANHLGDTPAESDSARAAWRSAMARVWVSGARHSLVVDENWNQRRIVQWLRSMASVARERISVDLLCHGGNATAGGRLDGTVLGYVARLGSGLAVSNVQEWHDLLGLVHKIRLFACGENNEIIGPAPAETGREELCWRLAEVTGGPVVSSPNSTVFGIATRPEIGTSLAGVDAEGWAPPVYRYTPDRRRLRLR